MPTQRFIRLPLLALVAGAIAIGFAPILVRLSSVGPSATAFYRVLFALPALWLLLAIQSRQASPPARPQNLRHFKWILAAGLLFVGDLSLWHWSLHHTTVANSTLITNCAPIFVMVGARFFFAEAVTRSFIQGLFITLLGGSLLVGASWRSDAAHLLGDSLALVAAVFYGGYQLMIKQLRSAFTPLTIMAFTGLVSCPGFLLAALLAGESVLPTGDQPWTPLILLALISHLGGQTLIAYAFGHLPAAFTSLSLWIQPVVAVYLAWILLDENLGWMQAAGGVIVLAGIALASSTLPARKPVD